MWTPMTAANDFKTAVDIRALFPPVPEALLREADAAGEKAAREMDYERVSREIYWVLVSQPAIDILYDNQRVPEPWPEPWSETRSGGFGGVVCAAAENDTSPFRKREPREDKEEEDHIPDPSTDGRDSLLDSMRGKWRMPPAWTRQRIEAVTGEPLETTARKIKAKTFSTFTACAKPTAENRRDG